MKYYKESNQLGELNEIKYKSQIQKIVGYNLESTDKFNTFDFINEDEKILVELKCRKCLKHSYNTTMIGMNKIEKSKIKFKEGYRIYYFFAFLDGLYHIQYNNKLEYEIRKGFRWDRQETIDKQPLYAYIHIDNLK